MPRSSHGCDSCSPLPGGWGTAWWLLALWVVSDVPKLEGATFKHDVMAVLSKAGCNAGTCHGNANGKGGFKLSLRGEDPGADHAALTEEFGGRRIDSVEPESSLLLQKATATVPHEGGKRFQRESDEFRLLQQWIVNGAPLDLESTPSLSRLEVAPQLIDVPPGTPSFKISAMAGFADSTRRDVARWCVYEVASGPATVSADGSVTRTGEGEAVVLVRYLDQQKAVRAAFLADRPGFKWSSPRAANEIDRHIFAKLRRLRINPSELSSDPVFVRRAYLDLLGVLPTAQEAKEFVSSRDERKRVKLIDSLLERPEFADFWALKWSDLLKVEERTLDRKGMIAFHRWIRDAMADNTPLDRFARELVGARGSTYETPPSNFYRANRDPVTRGETVAQVFLGYRLQCAQCHNHPFDKWSQTDYYDWAAVFGRIRYKVLENQRGDSNDSHEFKGEQIVYLASSGEVKNPKTGKAAQPRFLGAGDASKKGPDFRTKDEVEAAADWLTSRDRPQFARVQANRIWFNLLGRGLVEPIDDFRSTNPASHPELLEMLARKLASDGFDQRELIRFIMSSMTYQLSSTPNASNASDEANYAKAIIRRLGAEQLLDIEHESVGVRPELTGYPSGFRVTQVPGARLETKRGKRGGGIDKLLEIFGKPARLLSCECERSGEATMSQAFQMISGPNLADLIRRKDNRLTRDLEAGEPDARILDSLYWSLLTRPPTRAETEGILNHFRSGSERRAVYEDLLWALMNSKEFLFRL